MGNTLKSITCWRITPVHPHACGEHFTINCHIVISGGSSPRLWGTHEAEQAVLGSCRFIPTLVGNTAFRNKTVIEITVHPHACGEHAKARKIKAEHGGSSPRLWGTLLLWLWPSSGCRFIPTLVGNTFHLLQSSHPHSVHPHACGEHTLDESKLIGIDGSSPRLWGTHYRGYRPIHWNRFIPTLVGNTIYNGLDSYRWAVHPHACGEHAAIVFIGSMPYGSSPRLWGTLSTRPVPQCGRRFIPTLVGNT